MKKILIGIGVAVIMCGCGTEYVCERTAEEEAAINKQLEKIEKVRLQINDGEREMKGDNGVWCEDLCHDNWNGGSEMSCTVNCVNALRNGEYLKKED
jgi:hypothetical protein